MPSAGLTAVVSIVSHGQGVTAEEARRHVVGRTRRATSAAAAIPTATIITAAVTATVRTVAVSPTATTANSANTRPVRR